MQRSAVIELLREVGIDAQLSKPETLTSAITTSWGVDWDETLIARDILQNFYDANRNDLDSVAVQTRSDRVLIAAPAEFNLKRLFYLGSEKGESDVGQYGEGFKVAATCMLRDQAVTPIFLSGSEVLVLRVADRKVEGTELTPIEYDFYSNGAPINGSLAIFPGCNKKMVSALRNGLTHFLHDKNPLLGRKLWNHGSDFSLYESSTPRLGHVFYRNLKRGEIKDIPVVLVIAAEYKEIEKKISRDRDRNAFGEELMRVFSVTTQDLECVIEMMDSKHLFESQGMCGKRGILYCPLSRTQAVRSGPRNTLAKYLATHSSLDRNKCQTKLANSNTSDWRVSGRKRAGLLFPLTSNTSE